MTGLDRLRGYARRMDELHVWPGGAKLREIVDQVEREARRDHDGDVSASAYDLLPEDERDAVAFVRKCGGVEFLKLHMSNLRDFMLDVMDRLGLDKGDSDAPEIVFDVLDSRLMPEGMEWPRYEDGEPVRFGSDAADVFGTSLDEPVISIELFENGFTLHGDGVQAFYGYEERVKRPSVPAGDGEPLEVGQTVRGIGHCQHEFRVLQLNDPRPETDGRFSVRCFDMDEGEECWCEPRFLTHVNPEPSDSWERVKEDAMVDAKDYCESRGIRLEYPKHSGKAKCEDLVRRCKALAERGE